MYATAAPDVHKLSELLNVCEMAEPWLIRFFACNREMQPFFLFFFVIRCGAGGGGISGRVRALNLTVRVGSGQTISGTGRFGLQFWARADL